MASEDKLPVAMLFMLAWRNLWRNPKRTIITLSTIAIGFGLTVFSIGMQDSGHNNMVKNAINMGDGHITLQDHEYLASPANYRFIAEGGKTLAALEQLHIAGTVAPRISLQILASTANNSVGAALQGINADNDPINKLLQKNLHQGKWLVAGDDRGLLIGDGMARKLKAKIGSKIIVIIGKLGGDTEAQLGRVRGIFKSGISELDNYLILADLSYASRFLIAEGGKAQEKPFTRIAVFLDNEAEQAMWKEKIRAKITNPDIAVLSWQEVLPQLVQYIVVDDIGAYIMEVFILLVILFGIVNTVLMSVLERGREFGLLRALGLQRNYLIALVFVETLFLSVLAVVFGWLVGWPIHLYVATYGINFSAIIPEGTTFAGTFMDPIVYSELSAHRIVQLTVIVFFTTLASGIYPAIKAARVTPVEALRT